MVKPYTARQQQNLKIRGTGVQYPVGQRRHVRRELARDVREQGQELKRGEP